MQLQRGCCSTLRWLILFSLGLVSASSKFPSGEWIGFYVYSARAKRFLMDLVLTFAENRISGDGCDGIGPFEIAGDYSETTMECSWFKSYIGRHSVDYFGHREGKGIWGTWSLPKAKGGFHIWPIGSQPSLDAVSSEEDVELPSLLEVAETRPNQALERTADRREDLLAMTSTLQLEAQHALVSGRSACSR